MLALVGDPTLRCFMRSETRSSEMIWVSDSTYMQVQMSHRRHGVEAAPNTPLEAVSATGLGVLRCTIASYGGLPHARSDVVHHLHEPRVHTRCSMAAMRPRTAFAKRLARSARIESISRSGTVTVFFCPCGVSSSMTKGIRGRTRKWNRALG